MLTTGFGAFVVATVSDHFLEEQLCNHVARQHVPRVFIWTLGALLLRHLDVGTLARQSGYLMLAAVALIGVIPE